MFPDDLKPVSLRALITHML